MESLKEWLRPTVYEMLGAVLQHATNPSQHAKDKTYEDDGKTLRIRCFHPRNVQIAKFLNCDEPVQAEVSDMKTRMRATFTPAATQKWYINNRRRFTAHWLGGIIQLRSFEIVANHSGPRADRLTLLITDFNTIGSEGSGSFGTPRPFEVLEEQKELLQQLSNLRTQQINRNYSPSLVDQSDTPSTQSQVDSVPSSDECDLNSQLGFATQVPQPERSDRSANNFKSSGLGSLGIRAPSINDEPSANVATTTVEASPAALRSENMAPRNGQSERNEPSFKKPSSPRSKTQVLPPNKDQIQRDVMFKKTQRETANAQSRTPSESTIGQKQSLVSRSDRGPSENSNLPKHSKGTEYMSVEKLQTNANSPMSQVTEKPNDGSGTRAATSISGANARMNVATLANHTKASTPQKPSPETGRHLLSRIRRRDITISKDQQLLLDREDTWVPPEPGQRPPIASIPIGTLKALNDTADDYATTSARRNEDPVVDEAENAAGSERALSPTVESDENPHLREDSDSDIPIPAEEWGSSPPYRQADDQLPPDSSPPSPDHSHPPAFIQPPPTLLDRFQRRPSDSMESATSDQRYPARARKKRRLSDDSSSAATSPSGSDAKRYACKECDKVYKNLGSLKHHHDTAHTLNAPRQRTQRRIGPPPSKPPGSEDWLLCNKCHQRFEDQEGVLQHQNDALCLGTPMNRLSSPLKTTSGSIALNSSKPSRPTPKNLSLIRKDPPGNGNSGAPNGSRVLKTVAPQYTEPAKANVSSSHQLGVVSELEVVHPSPYDSSKPPKAVDPSSSGFPSTASQPTEPVVQVRRTPYVNGQPLKISMPNSGRYVSPYASPVQGISRNSDRIPPEFPPRLRPELSRIRSDFSPNNPEPASSPSVDETLIDKQVQSEIDAQSAQSPDDDSFLRGDKRLSGISVTVPQSPAVTSNKAFKVPLTKDDHAIERRDSAASPLPSPATAKRRFSLFSQEQRNVQHPKVLGRQYKEEFMASRKSSLSYASNEGSPKVGPMTTSNVHRPFLDQTTPALLTLQAQEHEPLQVDRSPALSVVASKEVVEQDKELLSRDSTPQEQDLLSENRPLLTKEFQKVDSRRETMATIVATSSNVLNGKQVAVSKTLQNHSEIAMTPLESLVSRTQESEKCLGTPGRKIRQAAKGPHRLSNKRDTTEPYSRSSERPDTRKVESKIPKTQTETLAPPRQGGVRQSASLHEEHNWLLTESTSSAQTSDIANRGPSSLHANGHVDSQQSRSTQDEQQKWFAKSARGSQQCSLDKSSQRLGIARDTQDAQIVNSSISAQFGDSANDHEPLSNSATVESIYRGSLSNFQANTDPVMDALDKEMIDTQREPTVESLRHDTRVATQNPPSRNTLGGKEKEEFRSQDQHKRSSSPNTSSADPNIDSDFGNLDHLEDPRSSDQMEDLPTHEHSFHTEQSPELQLSSPRLPTDQRARRQEVSRKPRQTPEKASIEPAVEKVSIFNQFQAAYPTYRGGVKHFTAICKKIHSLVSQERMEHPSLWDDFIIRHKEDYLGYVSDCVENAEEPEPYEKYYREKIEEPKYTSRIVTRKNLDKVLALGGYTVVPVERQKLALPKTGSNLNAEQRTTSRLESESGEERSANQKSVAEYQLPAELPENPAQGGSLAMDRSMPPPSSAIVEISSDDDMPPVTPAKIPATRAPKGTPRTTRPVKSSPRTLPWLAKPNDKDKFQKPLSHLNRTSYFEGTPTRELIGSPSSSASGTKYPSVFAAYESPSAARKRPGSPPEIRSTSKRPSPFGPFSAASSPAASGQATARLPAPRYEELERRSRSSQDTAFSNGAETMSVRSQTTAGESPTPAEMNLETLWRDPNSPFNSFARAWTNVRPGNNNSWAQQNAQNQQHRGRSGSNGKTKVDILRWEL